MTTKPPRTRTAQIRCQPCHYDQILKVANDERDMLESIDAEIVEIVKPAIVIEQTEKDMFQIGSRALLKYIKFFNEFPDFQLSNNFKTIARENPTIREMKVKQIERLIIERGV